MKTLEKETFTTEDYIRDTEAHIEKVREYLLLVGNELVKRSLVHDQSKLESPEKEIFAKHTPELDKCEFGSDEYKQHLEKVKIALDHHYANNRHHPNYFENGIRDMNLIDVVEMFCDWVAASEKHSGDIINSIKVNKKRFNYSDDLERIFLNTVRTLN